MNGFKSIFASKTFWGAAAGIASTVATSYGYKVTEGDLQTLITSVGSVAAVASNLFAIYGRVVAKDKIK